MDALAQIVVLLGFLLAGGLLVRLKKAPSGRIVDLIVRYVLWFLLFGMGFRIGNDMSLRQQIGVMGALAIVTAMLTVAGSSLAVYFGSFFIPGLRRESGFLPAIGSGGASGEAPSPTRSFRGASLKTLAAHLRSPMSLLAFVAAGTAAGAVLPPTGMDMGRITGWTLDALLFFIGMQFAYSGTDLRKVMTSPAALAVPLLTVVGTLAASLLLVPLFSMTPGRAMALAGGFGWYSLSGVLIGNLGDPALGSAAFLANMFRESIALLAIPFLGRTRVPSMAVSVGGATAMDVTLPLIEESAGAWIVPVSFLSGALLSLFVPILVPFCLGLG